MSTRKRYCACQEEAEWFCYRHRRHLCTNCIYDELNQRHITCKIGKYDDFIKAKPASATGADQANKSPSIASYRTNQCPICDLVLPDNDARAVVRLNCTCVYHSSCLQQYLLSNASNNVACPKCNVLVTQTPSKATHLSRSVDNFLRSVSRQRLWNIPKPHPAPISSAAPQTSTSTSMSSSANEHDQSPSLLSTAANGASHATNISAPPPKPVLSSGKQIGHIAVDMTRHRSVKPSFNRDGNKDDDKYHKPLRARKAGSSKLKGVRFTTWTTRKLLLALLVCLALIAQCWFVYTLFIKDNTGQPVPNVGYGGGSNAQQQPKDVDAMKQNADQLVMQKQGKIESMIHDLPPRLKNQILGKKKKKKLDDLQ